MNFTKMHGLGNDFILIEENEIPLGQDLSELAQKLCDRHFGIGADGLVIVASSDKAHAKMRIFNSDGSEAEMCGNAIRCFAKYLYKRGRVKEKKMSVETLAGLVHPELKLEDDRAAAVCVDMGEPRFAPQNIPVILEGHKIVSHPLKVEEKEFLITCVSMGNPHCVIITDNVNDVDLEKWGPIISEHPVFPQKTNVEFIQIIDPKHILMRVWERGVGETLACGTGACAAAVAGAVNEKCEREVEVSLLGGDLFIQWNEKNNHVYMTGPAEEVFTGEFKNL